MTEQFHTCQRCGFQGEGQVDDRYSFGAYAGRLCRECCLKFRDHCGLDMPEGSEADDYWDDFNY